MSLIIDGGHGGTDPGAVGNGIREEDYTLKISLYQYKRFKELGVPVTLTRSTDKTLDSVARTDIVRKSGMKHCMSNHINAGGGDGAEVIHSIHSNGKWANLVMDELVKVGQNKRRVFSRKSTSGKDYYYMHRLTGNVETIIVEYGFLDSKLDDVVQLKQHWETYAEAVVKAYCQYAGYTYKPKQGVKPVAQPNVPKSIFTDVPVDKFNYEDIKKAKELGLVAGYSDGTFRPNQPMTRSQMATVLVRLYEKLKG